MKELAILHHFYQLPRRKALKLPVWEWESLLKEYERMKAEESLKNLLIVSGGFNGGENIKEVADNWEKVISDGFTEAVRKDFMSEERLGEYDNFLKGFGI